MTNLPVAETWYVSRRLDERITLITEPHVHPIFSANMYLVEGSDKDLIIDTGMGVAPLRPFIESLRADNAKPLICLTTHTHVDHFGAVQEFDIRLVHTLGTEELAEPPAYSLNSSDLPARLVENFVKAGYTPLWPLLIDAVPYDGYDPATYKFKGATGTATVSDGDVIDLGDWQTEIIHLPGHCADQVGLWHEESGTLFSADAIYDGPLLWEGRNFDLPAYADTLRRLREMPVQVVHGGHDDAFGRKRMIEICDDYLSLWDTRGLI
ncbi:MBL fold metallo-hydrolase [Pseudoruegeria sp. HB172150]|uniref:MBL fold metallo-hydrolase n=1 Tax=Pseudoruegeria sp. HB172150 TaxID=2721164 RepID=UPI0015535A37|nr:MBL fold metallo-hydrolase [Pseudoruegeria sp. HB172150]